METTVLARRLTFFIILTACIWGGGCHSNAKQHLDLLKQSDYWINWEGNQANYATPANIWHGFIDVEENLIANDANPTIAFYLKETAPRQFVHLVYRSAAPGRIQIFVNEQAADILHPSSKLSSHSFSCIHLHKGFNQIRFAFADKSFHLRTLSIQKKIARVDSQGPRQLKEGEGFEVYLLPGRVDFEFQGQASLQAHSFGIADDRELSASISQTLAVSEKKTIYSHTSSTPFVARISCLQGSATVSHLWYHVSEPQKKSTELSKVTPVIDKNKIKDIFIFLLDGCQAQHLKLYGYSRNTAPRISEFAKDSLVFKQAFCNGSYTPAAVGSIFTGLYPDRHQISGIFDMLNKKIVTLPQFLKNKGYTTAVFTANAHISNRSGFVRGVDHYQQFLQVYRFGQSRKLVDAFADWVQSSPIPRFSYLHFMEPHFPIVPPPPFQNQYKKIIRQKKDLVIRQISQNDKSYSREEVQDVIDDYDSCINYVDSLFGQAIDFLKKSKRYDESLIILLADHGEACYEHGVWGHGHNAYAETTHVPLVIKFPVSCELKGETGSLVQTGAIFPTLYKILTDQDGPFDIPSFTTILAGSQPKAGGMVVTQGFKDTQIYAIAWSHWYYIYDLKRNREDLYDLHNEPFLSQALSQNDLASFLRLRFLGWYRMIQSKAQAAVKASSKSLSQEELDQLKSLGYL
jgi:arylsulfatase A-like enzyme